MSGHKSPIPLTDAFQLLMLENESRRFTDGTQEFYRYKLGQFMVWCETLGVTYLHEVTSTHIKRYLISQQEQGYADYTLHGSARAIRRFFRFCAAEGLIDKAPTFPMPQVDKRILPSFSLAEIKKLLRACESTRDEALVLVLLDTGLRASELIRLNGEHIHTPTGEVTVKQGKGRKDRTVFLGTKARKKLLRYYLESSKPGPKQAVWRNQLTGERLTKSGLYQLLRRLGLRAGVEHCHPHTFRRTFALWSLRAGMNIYALQKLMGHADLTTPIRYLGLTKEDLREAHQRYGAVDTNL